MPVVVQGSTGEVPAPKKIESPPAPLAVQTEPNATPAVKPAPDPTPASAFVSPVTPTKSAKLDLSPYPSTMSFPTVDSSHSTPTKEGSTRKKRQRCEPHRRGLCPRRSLTVVSAATASSEGLRTYSPTITTTTTTARTLPRNEVTHEPNQSSLFPSFAFLAFTRFHTTSFLSIPISLRKQLILRHSAYFPLHCSVNIISKCCTYLLFHE